MTGPIDVLAVMEAAEMSARVIGADEAADEFEAVRAAVAELIDADAEFHDLLARMRANPSTMLDSAIRKAERRAAAALGRVRGAP